MMGHRRAWAIVAMLASAAVAAPPRVVHLAPDGDDRWSGHLPEANAQRTDGPVASLPRLREVIRAERLAHPGSDVVARLQGGLYHLPQTLELTPEDAGGGGSVTWEAAAGEQPVIDGGRRIRGFAPRADGLWEARLPAGVERFEQLFVNGRRAPRARTPNRGYFYLAGTVAAAKDPVTGTEGPVGDQAFQARLRDLGPLPGLSPAELAEVVVVAHHSWEISRHRVRAIDPERGVVFLTGKYPPKFGHYANDERYRLENYRAALDEPGEWLLERDGRLLYLPRPGEDPATAEVIAPGPETLLKLAGANPEQPLAGLTLRGLIFRHAGYHMPAEGAWSPQAASNVGAAIVADYAHGLRFEDCTVERTGSYGIWLRTGCQRGVVQRCLLRDLGAGGVRIGVTNALPGPGEATGFCRVDNSVIHDGGQVWPDAVGVFVGHSGDNEVTHNDIARLPYTGVSLGWRWGYGEVPSQRNRVAYNRIHHLGWDVLADMGGIYTLGEAPGTILEHNVIHDIDGDGDSGMHGLYNDNSTSFMRLENNLVYRVRDGAYQLGSGKANLVRNNIFVADPRRHNRHGQFLFCLYYPTETHLAATVERNIFAGTGVRLFAGPEFGERLIFRDNLYWDPTEPLDFAGRSFEAWQALGRDTGSVIADPGFVDPERDDYRLRPDSPALALGFEPFDPAEAGLYGDPAWVARATGVAVPPWQPLPPAPPVTFSDGFETSPLGALPERANAMVESKGDSIAVTEAVAAEGARSLKVTDAPSLKYGFNPHFYYLPRHRSGDSTFSFDIRLEAGAHVDVEWRQYPGLPYYYVGPTLRLGNGQARTGERALAELPEGKWIHVSMEATMGREQGTWTLTLSWPGAEPVKLTDLPFGSPRATAVTWLGFINNADRAGTWYLDNVRLTNSASD